MWFWEFKKIVKLFQVESEKYFSKMLILAFQVIAILKYFWVHCAECYVIVHTTLKIMTHILFVWKGPPCLSKISKKKCLGHFFSLAKPMIITLIFFSKGFWMSFDLVLYIHHVHKLSNQYEIVYKLSNSYDILDNLSTDYNVLPILFYQYQ